MSKRNTSKPVVWREKWAAMVFVARSSGHVKPLGTWHDEAGFRPSLYELRGCCDRYLSKRGGWTKGLLGHLATREHVAHLMGVTVEALVRAIPRGQSRAMFLRGLWDGLFCPACLDDHAGAEGRPCYGKVCVKCYFPVFKDESHIRLGGGRLAHLDCWKGGV